MTKYLLAVSGGIDSMVMLDVIATNYCGVRERQLSGAAWPNDFMVAHFDHGIRGEDSHRDAEFVRQRCRQYGVACRVGCGHLSSGTSESTARQARYDYLYDCVATMGGDARIVTAHHRDDLLETVVMNLCRGTGWRGLAPMSQTGVIRPMLGWDKVEIATYAIDHNVDWVDDQTNYSSRYFRNRIRQLLATCLDSNGKQRLYQLICQQQTLRQEIEKLIDEYVNKHVYQVDGASQMNRYDLIMLPRAVAREVLRRLTDGRLTRPQLDRLWLFAKVAKPGKRMAWRVVQATVSVKKISINLLDE